MLSLSSILSTITEYTNSDIGTLVTLFVVFSLVIGLLVNLTSISFFSREKSKENDRMMNTVFKDSSNVKSTSTEDEQNQSEDHSQKKKIHHKTEGEETNFTSQRKKSKITRIDVSNPEQQSNTNSKQSISFSIILNCIFVLYLPILICSAIPSFYPIYKTYLTPYLPDYLQHFFTDVKNLFLSIINLFTSGAVFDGSYQSNDLSELFGNRSSSNHLLHSMQDWIYSYICNVDLSIQYSILSFCLSCTSPTPFHYFLNFGNTTVCTPCDYCFIETPPQTTFSTFSQYSCNYLMKDFSRLVNSHIEVREKSFLAVMKECFNTFLLYNRLFIHLVSRVCLHVLKSLSSLFIQIIQNYIWFGKKMIQTYSTNKTRSIALFFILILLLSLTVWMIRIFVKIILFIGRSFIQTFGRTTNYPIEEEEDTNESSIDELYNLSSQKEDSYQTSIPKRPAWFTPEIESSYRNKGINLDEQWKYLLKENPVVAELILACDYSSEEFDCLIRLLEQLHLEKEISDSVMEVVHTVVSSRPEYSSFKGYSSRAAPSLAFSPIPDVSSPTVFSPIQNIEGNRLPRTTSPNGFSRVVRPRIFRLPNTLKGKGIRTRNSVNSDSTSWSVKNEKEDLLNDLL